MPAAETERGGSRVATTEFVTSKDGTRIAFDRTGARPAVVLVAGEVLAPILAEFLAG